MREVHQYLGLAIAGLFLLLSLWGLVQWIRNTDPGEMYYRLLAVAQIGLVLQVIVGVIMFLFFRQGPVNPLHMVYGGFPILVLIFAHRYSRKLEGLAWVAFAIAGLFIFGLQLRGYMTGMEGA
ncbi:MAG TPA: hypothetical protein VHJ78_09965 [Actinomycetota bacterium]|nr:hypothetical protein [Actinomycetota bacterium]